MQGERKPGEGAEWIDSEAALKRWLGRVGHGPLAIDTESDQFHAYRPRVCLIQLCAGEHTALVDTLAFDVGASKPFRRVLSDHRVVKILHSAVNDLLGLKRDFGFEVRGIFDTELATHFLGYSFHGLSALMERFFDIKVSKKHQKFDWKRRPIPAQALQYAALDVAYLERLMVQLQAQLKQAGWLEAHRQSCHALSLHVEVSERAFNPHGWRRISGAKELSKRGQAALEALWNWRHQLCTKVNQAAIFVASDRTLLMLAERRPRELSALRGCHLSRHTVERYGSQILQTLGAAGAKPRPAPMKKRKKETSSEPYTQHVFKALRLWRNTFAEEAKLSPELIANNDGLKALAQAHPRSLLDLAGIGVLLPWQIESFGNALLEALEKARQGLD